MLQENEKLELKNGHWEWNDIKKCLMFITSIPIKTEPSLPIIDRRHKSLAAARGAAHLKLTFNDVINDAEQASFDHNYRHKSTYFDSNIIHLQDVKDIVLFLTREKLPNKFLLFFQTIQVNNWLRGTIVYMHYFLKACEELLEAKDLLCAPPPTDRPPRYLQLSQDLADLRLILGRQYSALVLSTLGSHGTRSNKGSGSDAIYFELLVQLGVRIVWIALSRKYLGVIEAEVNRVFRTSTFSKKQTTKKKLESQNFITSRTRDILYGNNREGKISFDASRGSRMERSRMMLQHSPIFRDFFTADDDRLLQIGRPNFETYDERLGFFTICFYGTEEHLVAENIRIGILGRNRYLYDIALHLITTEDSESSLDSSITMQQRNMMKARLSITTYQKSFPSEEVESRTSIDSYTPIPRKCAK